MFRIVIAALLLTPCSLAAQEWNTGPQTPSWTLTPTVGDGVDRFDEVSTAEQGGDPPALAFEPEPIDEDGNYTRTAWYGGTPSRSDQTEAKFRIHCDFSHFGFFDPILYPGEARAGHHHTFIGNKATDQNSDYTALREAPASTCSGGPTNATAYWEPTLFFEMEPGKAIYAPVKPNVVIFYYTFSPYSATERLYRIPRGLAFIGGVDPMDRLNIARLAEIPDGVNWEKTSRRYNGWLGWSCHPSGGGNAVTLAGGNTADASSATYARQLVNADGSDPWDGACEGTDKDIYANINAPGCWDGKNLASPNGRDHFRYEIHSNQTGRSDYCPDKWWVLPHFEAKTMFPNGHEGLGVSGHAWRSRLFLSSDRMSSDPDDWHPRGSTFHFDWMNGWDSVVQEIWQRECVGVAQDGVPGNPLTCDNSTISADLKLATGTSPDPSLSNDPIFSVFNRAATPARETFGPLETGTVVSITAGHHNH